MATPPIVRAATAVGLLWLSSCAGASNDSSATSDVSTADSGSGATSEGSAPMSSDIDPGLQPYIDIAVTDLSQRLAVDTADISVTSATLVVWPDSSLGCPAPGQQYAQVATDGALILLLVNGTEYQYHAGGSRGPFLCEKPGKSLSGTVSTAL